MDPHGDETDSDTEPDAQSWDNVHLGASNGDFARLVPHSPAARTLFSQVVRLLDSDASKWNHVRSFIHYEVVYLDDSTTGSSFTSATPSPQHEPVQEYCGYYRLNMTVPPANERLGWVLGSSRTNKPDNFVDFLLAPFTNEYALHSRHCRLRRLLETGVLLAISDSRKVSVDGKTVQRDIKREDQDEQDYQASLQHGTSIGLGDLTYRLVYTDLNPKQQQRELQEALKRASTGLDKSVMLLSPTPSRNTIDYHGYSIFDANLHGTTSTVSLGYDKSNGKPVAVKMVKCTAAQFNDLRKEIEILGRLNNNNVCKLEKVVNWNSSADPRMWRQDEGPTVGLILSPPATTGALGLLKSWKSLPDSATFLRDSMRQVASGLAHVHSLNILHRDIKPNNIVYHSISPVHAIIIDFGCSEPDPTSMRHDRGTMTYLAPEVMRVKNGESTQPFSFPSDVWSLGVTLVDFLLNKQFHKQLGEAATYEKFKKTMATNTVELHYPDFWDLVLEILAWDSEVRPTAMEVAQRLTDQEETRPEKVSRRASTNEKPSAKREKLQI